MKSQRKRHTVMPVCGVRKTGDELHASLLSTVLNLCVAIVEVLVRESCLTQRLDRRCPRFQNRSALYVKPSPSAPVVWLCGRRWYVFTVAFLASVRSVRGQKSGLGALMIDGRKDRSSGVRVVEVYSCQAKLPRTRYTRWECSRQVFSQLLTSLGFELPSYAASRRC